VRALFAATVGRFVKSKDKGVRKMWSEVGLGVAAGGNINPTGISMFEPMGGSAPKYTGLNVINPIAAIGAAGMMLDTLGERAAAAAVEARDPRGRRPRQVTERLKRDVALVAARAKALAEFAERRRERVGRDRQRGGGSCELCVCHVDSPCFYVSSAGAL
jgi:hypothetical protein